MLVGCLLGWRAHASVPGQPVFEHLGVEQGLSNAMVTAIAQDKRGFIWLATPTGLNRFDGSKVKVYSRETPARSKLANDSVWSLFLDREGELWLGGTEGLQRYDAATGRFLQYRLDSAEMAKQPAILAIVDDGRDGLWLGTNEGLHHFFPKTGQGYRLVHADHDTSSLSDNVVRALARDANGTLWVGTDAGLDRVPGDARSVQRVAMPIHSHGKLAARAVRAIFASSTGTLWVGADDGLHGLPLKPDGTVGPALAVPPVLTRSGVTAIAAGPDARLWIGTEKGLFQWETETPQVRSFMHVAADRLSLASHSVRNLLLDRSGTLWIGTSYAGASRVDLEAGGIGQFRHFGEGDAGRAIENVTMLTGDRKGRLWWSSDSDGIHQLDNGTDPPSQLTDSLNRACRLAGVLIQSVYWDESDTLWIGTEGHDMRRFQLRTGRCEKISTSSTLPGSNTVYIIFKDSAGAMWFGSRGGLQQRDAESGKMRYFQHQTDNPATLSSNDIYALAQGPDGAMWVATNYGLNRLDPRTGHARRFLHSPLDHASLANDRVYSLLVDRSGTVWVGTLSGLSRVEMDSNGGVHFVTYTVQDGLPSNWITGIIEDDDANIWLCTNAGISMLDRKGKRFVNYSSKDRVLSGRYQYGAVHKDGKGLLYFGGSSGISVIDPHAVRRNQRVPEVAVTDFQIHNQSLDLDRLPPGVVLARPIYEATQITLSHRSNFFSIAFAALHYAGVSHNRYAYQLDGFDTDWIYTDASKPFASYMNLEPGQYRFRVKAANKDGVWNEHAATLAIVLTPPFWKTWWFRSIAVALCLVGAYAGYRTRIRRLLAQRVVLERQVATRTAEVLHQKEIVEIQKAEVERQKLIVETANQSLARMSDIGRDITARLEPDAIMNTFAVQVTALMPCNHIQIGLLDADSAVIEFCYILDQGQRRPSYQCRIADMDLHSARCISAREKMFIGEQASDGATCPTLLTPMLSKGRVVGLIRVQSAQHHSLQRSHLESLDTLAAYLVVALDNADAYAQLGKALANLKGAQERLVLQEKMAALGTLTAGVAHEVNNPANFAHAGAQVMIGDLERFRQFLRALAGDDTEQEVLASLDHQIDHLAAQLATIIDGTSRIRDLVKDLRAFSRLDEADRKTVLVGDSLASTIRLVSAQYAADVDIQCALGANPPLECWPAQLNQVFMNVIVNACQAISAKHRDGSAQRGRLTIRSEISGDDLVLAFEDTGCGMSPEVLSHMFEPFYTTKALGEGTGLGMSISYGIVKAHGGNIDVRSLEGQGSTVTITLPLHTPAFRSRHSSQTFSG